MRKPTNGSVAAFIAALALAALILGYGYNLRGGGQSAGLWLVVLGYMFLTVSVVVMFWEHSSHPSRARLRWPVTFIESEATVRGEEMVDPVTAVGPSRPSVDLPAERTYARIEQINVPWSALREELWEGVVNRDLGRKFCLFHITICPRLTKSARDSTLEIRPAQSFRHGFLVLAYLSDGRMVVNQPPRDSMVIPTGDVLPDATASVTLVVASNSGGPFEPEFDWFLHEASGAEAAAGRLSFSDYVRLISGR